jgi:hypothetical protein
MRISAFMLTAAALALVPAGSATAATHTVKESKPRTFEEALRQCRAERRAQTEPTVSIAQQRTSKDAACARAKLKK